jgi:Calcium binding
MARRTRPGRRRAPSRKPSTRRLDEHIEQATVDAYDESEQATGFYTMLEERLGLPFKAEVLGVEVTVEGVDMDDVRIVAVCKRGKAHQRIPLLDLPLPTPEPEGAEWIAAYRRWARGGER